MLAPLVLRACRFYGRQVVSACVEHGTDYLDVSGEPEFMERMVADFHASAIDKGALVVSACGFDSVPAELGVQASVSGGGSFRIENGGHRSGEYLSVRSAASNPCLPSSGYRLRCEGWGCRYPRGHWRRGSLKKEQPSSNKERKM